MTSAKLIDREEERRTLLREAAAPGARLVLVHGRRRVGKTYLLQHAWKEGHRLFYFLAVDSTPDQNRRDLLEDLRTRYDASLELEDYPTWRLVFRLLGRLAGDAPLTVVLDEFQYLLAGEVEGSAVLTQLNAVWETDLSSAEVTLVLCGSEVGTMRELARRGALFGRLDREIHLEPFDYRQAAEMLPGRPRRGQAYLYGIFGGTPDYLDLVEEDTPLGEVVRHAFLERGGKVFVQVSNLVEQEEGIREPGHYRAVLAAIARGATQINEIAQAAGFDMERGGENVARRVLETLRDLRYVRRERNFDAGRTTPWRHHLADNALAFWYRFVHAHRSLLQLGEAEEVWRERIRPHLDDYMGWHVFEGMAREAFRIHHRDWGLPAAAKWTRWVGRDRNRRDIEIDVVARLSDDRLVTGEIKWSSTPVGPALHHHLQRDLQDLAASARGFARRALDADASHGHLYVSAAGFTDAFHEIGERDPRVRLVDLEAMYR